MLASISITLSNSHTAHHASLNTGRTCYSFTCRSAKTSPKGKIVLLNCSILRDTGMLRHILTIPTKQHTHIYTLREEHKNGQKKITSTLRAGREKSILFNSQGGFLSSRQFSAILIKWKHTDTYLHIHTHTQRIRIDAAPRPKAFFRRTSTSENPPEWRMNLEPVNSIFLSTGMFNTSHSIVYACVGGWSCSLCTQSNALCSNTHIHKSLQVRNWMRSFKSVFSFVRTQHSFFWLPSIHFPPNRGEFAVLDLLTAPRRL